LKNRYQTIKMPQTQVQPQPLENKDNRCWANALFQVLNVIPDFRNFMIDNSDIWLSGTVGFELSRCFTREENCSYYLDRAMTIMVKEASKKQNADKGLKIGDANCLFEAFTVLVRSLASEDITRLFAHKYKKTLTLKCGHIVKCDDIMFDISVNSSAIPFDKADLWRYICGYETNLENFTCESCGVLTPDSENSLIPRVGVLREVASTLAPVIFIRNDPRAIHGTTSGDWPAEFSIPAFKTGTRKYKLRAVVHWLGSHWISYVRVGTTWWYCNDMSVSESDFTTAISGCSVAGLFYGMSSPTRT
jgi:hypothetical protein